MSDVFDEIIDNLPPATVRLLFDADKVLISKHTCIANLLNDLKEVKLKEMDRELKRKMLDVKSKTAQNLIHGAKLKRELEIFNSLKEPKNISQNLKTYSAKIEELEEQIKELTKAQNDIDLGQLFSEVEELKCQIEEFKKRINEARSEFKCYNGFPPDIEEGKTVIVKMKEKIKQQELAVEALFQNFQIPNDRV